MGRSLGTRRDVAKVGEEPGDEERCSKSWGGAWEQVDSAKAWETRVGGCPYQQEGCYMGRACPNGPNAAVAHFQLGTQSRQFPADLAQTSSPYTEAVPRVVRCVSMETNCLYNSKQDSNLICGLICSLPFFQKLPSFQISLLFPSPFLPSLLLPPFPPLPHLSHPINTYLSRTDEPLQTRERVHTAESFLESLHLPANTPHQCPVHYKLKKNADTQIKAHQ